MRSIVLVAACLACAGHARNTPHSQQQVKHGAEQIDLKTLSTLLLASSPRSAFSSGAQPVTAKRNAGVKMSLSKAVRQAMWEGSSPRQIPIGSVSQVRRGSVGPRGNSFWNGDSSQRLRRGSVGHVGSSFRNTDSLRQIQRGRSNFWDRDPSQLVQGGSLRTWSDYSNFVDSYNLDLNTDGRPLDADIQLWDGPDNTPYRMRVYSEGGEFRPISTVIPKPYGRASTVSVRNAGLMEFPLSASVSANDVREPSRSNRAWWETSSVPYGGYGDSSIVVQGGSLRTFEFDSYVEAVEVVLTTDGMPLQARIELLQGPNRVKEAFEVDSQDGLAKPFSAIIPVSGYGCTVCVYNTASMTFPLYASARPA